MSVWLFGSLSFLTINISKSIGAQLWAECGEEWNFDGVFVSANDSIDGKEHIISSFKEYAEFTKKDK